MQDNTLKYEKLKSEYENYQVSSELQMQKLSKKIMKLEKDINVLANIVEISKYINTYLSDENLILMINDMILGLFGVSYSTILLHEDGKMRVKATNIKSKKLELTKDEEEYIALGKSYLINNKKGIRLHEDTDINICSVIGMPIKLREKYIGFIIVEHKIFNFLDKDHDKFLNSIANQIAIELENSMLYRELQEIAKRDPLLGIYNRRYFFESVEEKVNENPLHNYSIVMIDLDNFKKVNDSYGHQFGDKVLIETVKVIQDLIDKEDILARYGGEEIIIYIDGFKSKSEVIDKVNNIRSSIEHNTIHGDMFNKNITCTLGVSFSESGEKDVEEVLKEADNLLYEGKRSGKNIVVYSN